MSSGPWKKGRTNPHINDAKLKGGKLVNSKLEERRRAKAMGMNYLEEQLEVYIRGPGELAPKRSHFMMGRSIHRGLVAVLTAKKELGSGEGQADFFRRIFLQAVEELNQLRKLNGLPAINIDPTVWINPDRLRWATPEIKARIDDHAANGRLTRRRKVLVDNNSGTPAALIDS